MHAPHLTAHPVSGPSGREHARDEIWRDEANEDDHLDGGERQACPVGPELGGKLQTLLQEGLTRTAEPYGGRHH